jgi:CDP-4-dehydro-6-deoxyglucose reductase, E3
MAARRENATGSRLPGSDKAPFVSKIRLGPSTEPRNSALECVRLSNPSVSLLDVDPIGLQSSSAAAVLLRLRTREPSSLRWRPGQHLELFVGDATQGIPYSIASAEDPERPAEFELAISKDPNAEWLARVRSGQRLRVSAARGEFVWKPGAKGSLFIGMGTGLAPLRAMLQAARREPSGSHCTLLFGARTLEDILWRTEFEHWASEVASFRFEPTLSQGPSAWAGRRGRVQAHLSDVARELAGFAAYVCGSPSMVSDCVRGLTSELGFDPKLVFSEAH